MPEDLQMFHNTAGIRSIKACAEPLCSTLWSFKDRFHYALSTGQGESRMIA